MSCVQKLSKSDILIPHCCWYYFLLVCIKKMTKLLNVQRFYFMESGSQPEPNSFKECFIVMWKDKSSWVAAFDASILCQSRCQLWKTYQINLKFGNNGEVFKVFLLFSPDFTRRLFGKKNPKIMKNLSILF